MVKIPHPYRKTNRRTQFASYLRFFAVSGDTKVFPDTFTTTLKPDAERTAVVFRRLSGMMRSH